MASFINPRSLNLKWERFPHIPKLQAWNFAKSSDLPSSVDLRARLPPVFHQGNLGSCTANALSAAFAFDDPSMIGSRLFLYYNERKMEDSVNDDAGACLSDGVEALHIYGICAETSWPYSDDGFKFKQTPPDQCYQGTYILVFSMHNKLFVYNIEAVSHEATSYHHVEPTEEALKAALASGFPLVSGIKVFHGFMSTYDGHVPLPNPSETPHGGHAILLVGYNDATREWLVRNSWGADWGDQGHFYLPYEYMTDSSLDLAHDIWVISKVSSAPVSTPPMPIKPHRKHRHHHHYHHHHPW